MKNLKGRVVLITGGASGLGRAAAVRFAEEGAKVVIADMDVCNAEAVANQVSGHFVQTDVSVPASVEAAVASAVSVFGRLDVMVNNAGIESQLAPTHECTVENWRRVIDVNLSGVFYGMKYAIAQFLKQPEAGNVVNVASTAGLVGMRSVPPYNAAKAGVVNLTRAGALEYGGASIRVNAVAPTAVQTALFERMSAKIGSGAETIDVLEVHDPLKGHATPEDIAAAIAFLASDDARFITGVTLPVDGGFTAQ